MTPSTTIGVFDSGFGGLTVLRELLPLVPGAHYVYLGDTARLPYGSKSQATIARYAVESARFLEARGADQLVIACNTASALAMPEITAAVRIPVTGVIAPVVETTHHRHPAADTLILATAATVHSHAYRAHCEALGLHATEKACPLLVPLIEEGWIDHPVTREVLRIYLSEALGLCSPQVVILGCTHYPLIAPLVTETLHSLGSSAQVIDSAQATARTVESLLSQNGTHPAAAQNHPAATCEFFATDSVEKFARLGSAFLGRPVDHVQLLDLGG
ncbi:MAG TPA: glutamate racemase [Acidobacteriaceae bacterium]|nr:glutamate racemase [Acidobacteriaceae bacterium]